MASSRDAFLNASRRDAEPSRRRPSARRGRARKQTERAESNTPRMSPRLRVSAMGVEFDLFSNRTGVPMSPGRPQKLYFTENSTTRRPVRNIGLPLVN